MQKKIHRKIIFKAFWTRTIWALCKSYKLTQVSYFHKQINENHLGMDDGVSGKKTSVKKVFYTHAKIKTLTWKLK